MVGTKMKGNSYSLMLIQVGFLGVRVEVGGITPCLKLVKIMLETLNLIRKYTYN